MKSIGTRFSLAVGAFAVVFSVLILYRSWSATKAQTEELTAAQARLALEFDVALRAYAGEVIRPEMEKRIPKDDFVVEAMSTSYIARSVFEKVRKKFPDYLIKFSSDNPRNPVNRAGPEEMELIRYFQVHTEADRWTGRLAINGNEFLAHVHAMRIEQGCLRCHGSPSDSPKSLLDRYGSTGAFHRKIGDVAGLDVIAVPMEKLNAALALDARTNLLTSGIFLSVLFGFILVLFRYMVARRLAAIAAHFEESASQTGDVAPVPVRGDDEIGVLARSFNALAARLRALHESLEDRVRQRTAELARQQETLRQLLRSSDHERQLIAYEIHDGLAQTLAGAAMQLDTYQRLQKESPDDAAQAYEAASRYVQQSLAEARRLISGLRPPILDELGIVPAIAHLVHDIESSPQSPEILLHSDVAPDRLAPVLENAVYRIVQEGLGNAVKHSKSDKVRVALARQGDTFHMEIQDWGTGFDAQQVPEGCFGLKGILERARVLGGSARIDSAPGRGTTITVDLPVLLREPDAS